MNGLAAEMQDIDDEFSRFFRGVGLDVTWDHSRDRSDRWYEILDGRYLLAQVPFGTPLQAFLIDLVSFAAGEERGTSTHEYVARGSPSSMRVILERVRGSRRHE